MWTWDSQIRLPLEMQNKHVVNTKVTVTGSMCHVHFAQLNSYLQSYLKYQGVKEFHMLARIGCFKNYGFQSF